VERVFDPAIERRGMKSSIAVALFADLVKFL
jgi:hypothetical protein